MPLPLELRTNPLCLATPAQTGSRVTGKAVVYGSESVDLGGYVEVIKAGAFTESLANPNFDARITFNHNYDCILGRKSANTCSFIDSPTALSYVVDFPNTDFANNLLVSMRRGDITGSSLGFLIQQAHWESRVGRRVRVIDKGLLVECSVVAFPAYLATSAQIAAAASAQASMKRFRMLDGVQ
jgi:hypothetical protein